MTYLSPQSLMPVVITGILSLLFKGGYGSSYALSLITGLTFFFYFAECTRRTARALKTRRVHHYAIPLSVLRLYAPSIITLIIIWVTRSPLTLAQFLTGIALVTANALMLWGFIWGASQFVSRKYANNHLFMQTINYGLHILMLCTPIFYALNAIRAEPLRILLSYNPLAIAIITTRASLLGVPPAIPFAAAGYALAAGLVASFLGYTYSRLTKDPY